MRIHWEISELISSIRRHNFTETAFEISNNGNFMWHLFIPELLILSSQEEI